MPNDRATSTDGGKPEKGNPERRCIVTRENRPPSGLIRFVLAPDNQVAADFKRRLPGRGAWVGAELELVGQAVAKNLFKRALGLNARAPQSLADDVAGLMRQDLLGILGLARKGGQLTTGAEKVAHLVSRGRVAAVFQASDAADDGKRRIEKAVSASERPVPVFDRMFTADEMSLALGGGNVVHAALEQNAAAEAVVARCIGYEKYLGRSPDGSMVRGRDSKAY